MKEKIEELANLMEEVKADGAKFLDKGNKAAGKRARVGLSKMRSLAQEIRRGLFPAKDDE